MNAVAHVIIWCFIITATLQTQWRLGACCRLLCFCRLQCPVRTCNSWFSWILLRQRRRWLRRDDPQPTLSFALKQSFLLFHIDFHRFVDQYFSSLTTTRLASETGRNGSKPCIFNVDPVFARMSKWIYASHIDSIKHKNCTELGLI